MDTRVSADPTIAEFMRLVGEKPLLTKADEQRLGVLVDRQRHAETLMSRYRGNVGAGVALGILKRISLLRNVALAAAWEAELAAMPRLDDLARQTRFRAVIDHKVPDGRLRRIAGMISSVEVKRVAPALTQPPPQDPEPMPGLFGLPAEFNAAAGGDSDQHEKAVSRLLTQLSRDTLCLTPTLLVIAGDLTINDLNRPATMKTVRWMVNSVNDDLFRELQGYVDEGYRAQHEISECNMRLVVHTARNFINNNMDLVDLSQEGALGLVDAAKRFDHRLGYKFSTYAHTWIRHRILKALFTLDRTIRIPHQKYKLTMSMYYARERLQHDLNAEPTIEELAREMGITVEQVAELQRIDQEPDSLDAIIWDDNSATPLDRLANRLPGTDELAMGRTLKPAIHDALQLLDEKERAVIIMRYGLEDDRPCTITDISVAIHTSKERARKIEKQAIDKLRSSPEVLEKLRDYLAPT